MPEYLAPGVYVEETSFRQKTIEGVSTSTAGFIGAARFGPTAGVSEVLTSFAEFERVYGSLDQLVFDEDSGTPSHNFLAHAVRAFFNEGGKRLYVTRTYNPPDENNRVARKDGAGREIPYGHAFADVPGIGSPISKLLTLRARYPGRSGDMDVIFTIRVGQNVLGSQPRDPDAPTGVKDPVLRGVNPYDLVWIGAKATPPDVGALYWAERYFNTAEKRWSWRFHPDETLSASYPLELASVDPDRDRVRVVNANVQITTPGRFPRTDVWEDVAFHPGHPRSLSKLFAPSLSNRLQALTVPIIFEPEVATMEGPEIARIMLGQPRPTRDIPRLLRLLEEDPTSSHDARIIATLDDDRFGDAQRQYRLVLEHGSDGDRPEPKTYAGSGTDPKNKTGLAALEDVSDISILAAPGHSFIRPSSITDGRDAQQVAAELIAHSERMKYRVAVLDSQNGQALSEVLAYRGQLDSSYAGLYYPWVHLLDPVTEQEIDLPPSGFVSGIFARNDVEKGVHKAPANEVVQSAIGFEILLNKGHQDVLNPAGVNCFRFFEGRGYRLWGARTISSDPERKYMNKRRYLIYLERSVDRGTQWVVFENNSEPLWANVRSTVEDFLFNEWKSGHLLGTKPEEAYFVRCDRSTMTQNDFDNGRLICLVGVALIAPAEFVIFRIGQWVGQKQPN